MGCADLEGVEHANTALSCKGSGVLYDLGGTWKDGERGLLYGYWPRIFGLLASAILYSVWLCYYLMLSNLFAQENFKEGFANRLGSGAEITCLAWVSVDPECYRVAAGTYAKQIQVCHMDGKGQVTPIYSVELDSTIPKAIGFMSKSSKDLFVFGMWDGQL